MTFLDEILEQVRIDVASAKRNRSKKELQSMIRDVAPVLPFDQALAGSFGLIAEIKKKSPSVGPMRLQNFEEAALAYEESDVVYAVSILTNTPYFGMAVESLAEFRKTISKPIIRKEFIVDEYQVHEARAFGADAILLMANVLDAAQLSGFYDLARELGMEALFEVHTPDEIQLLPRNAKIVGINSRKFKTQSGFVGRSGTSTEDFTVDLNVFELHQQLPPGTLTVAESGLSPASIETVREKFNAALVGTSLLRDERGIRAGLKEFEKAIQGYNH